MMNSEGRLTQMKKGNRFESIRVNQHFLKALFSDEKKNRNQNVNANPHESIPHTDSFYQIDREMSTHQNHC